MDQFFTLVRRKSDGKVLRTIALVHDEDSEDGEAEVCVLEDLLFEEKSETVMRTMHLWHKLKDYDLVKDGADGVKAIY